MRRAGLACPPGSAPRRPSGRCRGRRRPAAARPARGAGRRHDAERVPAHCVTGRPERPAAPPEGQPPDLGHRASARSARGPGPVPPLPAGAGAALGIAAGCPCGNVGPFRNDGARQPLAARPFRRNRVACRVRGRAANAPGALLARPGAVGLRWPDVEAGMGGIERFEHFTDRGTVERDFALPIGERTQLGGDADGDRQLSPPGRRRRRTPRAWARWSRSAPPGGPPPRWSSSHGR